MKHYSNPATARLAQDARCLHCRKPFTDRDIRNSITTGTKGGSMRDVHRECYWAAIRARRDQENLGATA